jgi:hypothetical protein
MTVSEFHDIQILKSGFVGWVERAHLRRAIPIISPASRQLMGIADADLA